MRDLRTVLTALTSLISVNAAAAVVGYNFQMTVEDLWEFSSVPWQITHVNSSVLPEPLFSVGDKAQGFFRYSTGMELSRYRPGPGANGSYKLYTKGILLALPFGNENWTYRSNPDTWQSLMQVADNASSHLIAPGSLFSPEKSVWWKMRFNISRTLDGPALPALARAIEASRRSV